MTQDEQTCGCAAVGREIEKGDSRRTWTCGTCRRRWTAGASADGDAPCAVCGTARSEHRYTEHDWTPVPDGLAAEAQVPGPRAGDDYPAGVVEDTPEVRALLANVDKTARTLRTARQRAQDAADAADDAILAAVRAGVPKLAIVKRLGVARMTVEQAVRRAQERAAGDA